MSVLVCTCLATPAAAQRGRAPDTVRVGNEQLIVKTVTLHRLSALDAMQLLSPYARGVGTLISPVQGLHAITIRATSANYDDMLKILDQYDRDEESVTLYFQVIAADDGLSTGRDPAVAGLDSLLRGVLKYSAYHLAGAAILTTSENSPSSQSVSARGHEYTLNAQVSDVRVDGKDASVHIDVDLAQPLSISSGPNGTLKHVLRTGVTVPIGQTVVLGTTLTSANMPKSANGPAEFKEGLILTVRPQLTASTKRD